ncbi:MAG: hypothetical protein GY795_42350 [Desulfobacterales bacterium]|nr:hypothetical protein [Desulfobacterales bacterium]
MQTIHKVARVVNNQVIIDLPPDYANEVEITLKPLTQKDSGIYELEREIDIGKESSMSPRSHNEIFENLRKRYEF